MLIKRQAWFSVVTDISYGSLCMSRDWMSQVAAHGFVTLQPFPFNGGFQLGETLQWVSTLSDMISKISYRKLSFIYLCLNQLTRLYSFQLQENLTSYISTNLTMSWDHVGFACHSSGCEEFLAAVETFDDPTFAKVTNSP